MTDPALGLGAYLLGTAELAAIALPLAYAATRARAHFLPTWHGAPARLAEAITTLTLLIWTSQLLGTIGQFKPIPLIAASLLIAIAVRATTARPSTKPPHPRTSAARPSTEPPHPRVAAGGAPADDREVPASQGIGGGPPADRTRGQEPPSQGDQPTTTPPADSTRGQAFPIGFTTAAIAAAIVAASWAIPMASSYAQGITGVDSMWYHLPQSARFLQTGSVTELHFTDPYFLNWFYPANSELLHALGVLVYERDWLSPAINHGFLVLGLLAGWCIGRPWGAGPAAMVGVAIVFGSEMMLDFQPGEARNDAAGLALFLAAVALLVTGPRRGPVIAVAGLAAGLAVGTKLTLLAPVAALTVAVAVVLERHRRARGTAVFLAAGFAAGGFWYVRNLVHSGNPLPWIDRIGPLELPAPEVALELRPPFSLAHYATDFDVWGEWLIPGLANSIGPLWPAVLAITVGAAALALWRGDRLAGALGGVVVATLVAYVFTPLTASGPEGMPEGFVWNLRYIAPALGLGLALPAILPPLRGGRAHLVLLAGLLALLIAQAATLEVWDGGQRSWALGSAALTLGLFAGGRELIRRRASLPLSRPAVAGGLAAAVAIVLAAGYVEQKRYMSDRYRGVLAGLHLDAAVAWAEGVAGAEIATAGRGGAFFQYGFYGSELSNRVQWVGRPAPRGAWLPIDTCEGWREAVNEGGYDYVVTTYDRRFPGADETSREREWIRRDPAAAELLADGPVAVYELAGRLDPSGCGARETAAATRPTGVARRDDD